jgi:hypothetical protein
MDEFSELEGVFLAVSVPDLEINEEVISGVLAKLEERVVELSNERDIEVLYRLDLDDCQDVPVVGLQYPDFRCYEEAYPDEVRDLWVLSQLGHSGSRKSGPKAVAKQVGNWLPIARKIHRERLCDKISLAIRFASEYADLEIEFDEDSTVLAMPSLGFPDMMEKEEELEASNRGLKFFEPVFGKGVKWVLHEGDSFSKLEADSSVRAKLNFHDVITHLAVEDGKIPAFLRCVEDYVRNFDGCMRFAMKIEATLDQLRNIDLPIQEFGCMTHVHLEDCAINKETRLNALKARFAPNELLPLLQMRSFDADYTRDFGLAIGAFDGDVRLVLTNWSHQSVFNDQDVLDLVKPLGWKKYFKSKSFLFS